MPVNVFFLTGKSPRVKIFSQGPNWGSELTDLDEILNLDTNTIVKARYNFFKLKIFKN